MKTALVTSRVILLVLTSVMYGGGCGGDGGNDINDPTNGTDHTFINIGGSLGSTPSWSPDGATIAFIRYEGKSRELCTVPVSGGSVSVLAADATYSCDWSPDGSKIAYDSPGGIYIISADGGSPSHLAMGIYPTWSSDGSRIAYLGSSTRSMTIYSIPVVGGTPQTILADILDISSPQWSPVGNTILFSQWTESEGRRVHLVSSSGGSPVAVNVTGLPVGSGWVSDPSWSSDGQTIVFNHNSEIWSVSRTGGAAELLIGHGDPNFANYS